MVRRAVARMAMIRMPAEGRSRLVGGRMATVPGEVGSRAARVQVREDHSRADSRADVHMPGKADSRSEVVPGEVRRRRGRLVVCTEAQPLCTRNTADGNEPVFVGRIRVVRSGRRRSTRRPIVPVALPFAVVRVVRRWRTSPR
jgi:hypothetical protein